MNKLYVSALLVLFPFNFSLCTLVTADPIVADGLVAYWSFIKTQSTMMSLKTCPM